MKQTEDELERKWRSQKLDSSDTKAIGAVMLRNAIYFTITAVATALLCMASGKLAEPWGIALFLLIALSGGLLSFHFAFRWYGTYVIHYLPALNKETNAK